MFDDEIGEICRDESCEQEGIHARHKKKRAPSCERPYHRSLVRPPWRQPDPDGLLEAILKAVPGRVPVWFQQIAPDVRDDFGDVTDRSIWRGIKKLVERGQLLKLDLGLSFAAYMRPIRGRREAGRLDDFNEQRDYMLSIVEIHPARIDG